VLSSQEIESIASVAIEHDLFVIADEIYEHYTFDNRKHVSIGSLPALRERTITVNGFSKSHAMTGWRLGYLGTTNELQSEILSVQQHLNTCATSFVQHAGVTALETTDHLGEVIDRYRKNRDIFVDIVPLDVIRPEGTFYALVDVRSVSDDEINVASDILETTGVAVTPGRTYGTAAEGYVRVSLAKKNNRIRSAAERLRGWYRDIE
jgi:aspartate/methionine/tyrosine aminotransferase